MGEASPLDAIKQAEMEVVRRVAEAQAAAEDSLLKTQSQIETLLNTLRAEGEATGQALYADLLASTETETERLISNTEAQVAELHARGDLLLEEAIAQAVNIITGRE